MRTLSRLPAWLFSILTLALILWLTLAPKPLGEEPPTLFPGADKIVHALMFGFLTAMFLLDFQRKNNWKTLGWWTAMSGASLSTAIGISIEYLQNAMGLGRGFEVADIVADTLGSFIAGTLWIPTQNLWLDRTH